MDPELDDLLNDALADFDKPPSDNSKVKSGSSEVQNAEGQSSVLKPASQAAGSEKSNTEGAVGDSAAPPSEIFQQFFDKDMTKRLEQEWESAMKELAQDDPALASHFQKLSTTLDAATAGAAHPEVQDDKEKPTEPVDLEKVMKETISGIEKSADELKNMSSEEAEAKLFDEMNNLGLGGGMADMMSQMGEIPGMGGDFMQMMEGMMQNLLSKDVLYPTMKEISKSYPEWLQENEIKVSKDDFQRYKKQNNIITKICEAFEEERDNDTSEIKRQRLNTMMLLVEQMQECGNPPKDLLEKCAGGSPVDMDKFFGAGPDTGPDMFKPGGMNPDGCLMM